MLLEVDVVCVEDVLELCVTVLLLELWDVVEL